MNALERTENWPGLAQGSAPLLSGEDLLRLKAIARLHARGLPPHLSCSDLLQEAFKRVLDGSRRPPPDVPAVAFLAEVMRSIKEHYGRQHRRRARQQPKLLAELEAVADYRQAELADPTPTPERRVMATQQVESISALFQNDLRASQIISALYEGLTPAETGATYAMSRTDYDSTRKRMRRALIRAGMRTRYDGDAA